MESSAAPIAILAVFGIIALISLAITIAALVDIIKNDFKGPNDKLIWILLTLPISPIGGILYFIIGRKQKVGS